MSGEESLKESEDKDSATEEGEVDGPPKKVAEITHCNFHQEEMVPRSDK